MKGEKRKKEGKNSVDVMNRKRMNENDRELHGLIAGWAPAESSLCQLSRTSARDRPEHGHSPTESYGEKPQDGLNIDSFIFTLTNWFVIV